MAAPGSEDRATPRLRTDRHRVSGNPLVAVPEGMREAFFSMGCFWGAERAFWTLPGVYSTAVGYAGGTTRNPTYREVCTGSTGHAEAVRVVYDPMRITYEALLRTFWERHDPTQGMRQGNDVGSQYRSCIFTTGEDEHAVAEASRAGYQRVLDAAGYGSITTDILPAGPFYFAEDEHQQYLARHPGGYCGLGGTGVACPVPLKRVE